MYDNRQYAVFAVGELNLIDFSQVLETSVDTVRKSVDGTRTFVKWDGVEQPACINSLTTIEGTYTHEAILAILNGADWASPMNDSIQGGQGGG